MAERTNPSALRWLIGVELANFRKRTGLDQAGAAKRAGISRAKVSHMETGERKQQPADIAKLLAAYNARQHEINRLTSLAEVPDESTWWGAWSDVVPNWFDTFVGLERLATKEFVFEPIVIPGLLQTEDYARELSRSSQRVRVDHNERVVELRMERAQRLTADNNLNLHAVVTEQALRLRIGNLKIQCAQYEHLIKLAERPNVKLQIVTPDCGPHEGVTGQFAVLEFEKARPIVYAEALEGAMYVQHPGAVDTYREASRSLEEVSLQSEDSIRTITELIREL